eukprot:GHVO01016259.1.p1 GENE.GHVO01016259.1~~GHVO01016259.1.p1  ORF type:complete len:503 (+),score=110.31 GHVO01016259.1:1-1509(+)
MLLNLIRVEGFDPEYMIERSFFQFQKNKASLALETELKESENGIRAFGTLMEKVNVPKGVELPEGDIDEIMAEHYAYEFDIRHLREEMTSIIHKPEYIGKFLQPGRLVRIKDGSTDWGYGVLAQAMRKKPRMVHPKVGGEETDYIVDALVEIDPKTLKSKDSGQVKPQPLLHPSTLSGSVALGKYEVVPMSISCIKGVTQVCLKIPHGDLKSPQSRSHTGQLILNAIQQFDGSPPLLHPIEHLKIKDEDVVMMHEKIVELTEKLERNPLNTHPLLRQLKERMHEKISMQTRVREIERELLMSKHLVMKDDLKAMRSVLKKLGYLDKHDVPTLKGRIGCEISTADELVIAELFFRNVFGDLDIMYIVAMLSCLVFEDKTKEPPPKDETCVAAFQTVQDIAKRIAQVSVECRLPVVEKDYVDKFKSALMEPALHWFNGKSFGEILKGKTIFEGSLVRAIRRLEELLRQLASASKAVGNELYEQKFTEAILKVRRGIVFAASLYL